jgi:HAD superfamily hydrolase (TIGR01549 family)
MIKAILFDLDGVLIDSMKTHYYATNSATRQFGKKVTLKEFKEKFWGVYIGDSTRHVFGNDSLKIRKVVENYRKNVPKYLKYTKVYPNAKEVLEKLKDKRLKLGIITSCLRRTTEELLKYAEIENFFDVIISGEDTKPKPAPDAILKACRDLKVKPSEVVYVGDTRQDVVAGKSAGCFTVAITTSNSRGRLKGADIIVDNLKELLAMIRRRSLASVWLIA